MNDLRRRVRGLELLLRLSLELHSERDIHKLLDRIWKELTRVLEAERSSLFLVDEETGELFSVVAQDSEEIRFPKGAGIAGAVAATGVSLLIPEPYSDPRFNPAIDRRSGFRTRSILSVPLKNPRGEVLGVAQVLNRRDGCPFDDEDRLLLEALAGTAGAAVETVQLYEEQILGTEAVIAGLLMGLEMRDLTGPGHSRMVRMYSRIIAREMGLPETEVRRTEWAAALHDVGKISTPDAVLNKEAALTTEERAQYEGHASRTRELLNQMGFAGELAGVEDIAPYHHKRFEGGGFPEGEPEGEEVPVGARIIAVADALWVRMHPRWGRPASAPEEAMAWIGTRAGTEFDPQVVEALNHSEAELDSLREAEEGLGGGRADHG